MKHVSTGAVVLALAVSLVLASGCATGGGAARDTEAFRAEVDRIFSQWGDGAMNGDVEKYMGVWDEDLVKMANGTAPIKGRAALEAKKRQDFQTKACERFEVDIQEVQLAGDFGWARGSYVLGIRSIATGQRVTKEGVFLTIFHRQPDGTWRVYRDTMMGVPAA